MPRRRCLRHYTRKSGLAIDKTCCMCVSHSLTTRLGCTFAVLFRGNSGRCVVVRVAGGRSTSRLLLPAAPTILDEDTTEFPRPSSSSLVSASAGSVLESTTTATAIPAAVDDDNTHRDLDYNSAASVLDFKFNVVDTMDVDAEDEDEAQRSAFERFLTAVAAAATNNDDHSVDARNNHTKPGPFPFFSLSHFQKV